MPELPEVETIRRGLNGLTIGKTIKSIQVFSQKSFIGTPEQAIGLTVTRLDRRGKALIIHLGDDLCFLIHLRMTGQLVFRAGEERRSDKDPVDFAGGHPTDSFINELPDKHTRVQITFTDGSNLYFNDQRKFGFVKLLPLATVKDEKFFQTLGPEPLNDDTNPSDFFARLQKHPSTTIKGAILDQSTIAGVGNIYADESLFYARIHPARKVSTVTSPEATKLLEGIRKVMTASIDSGGSTMKNYVKADGTKGNYLDLFAQVFRKENTPCPRCGTDIIKIRVAGRGTHLCPHCQKPTAGTPRQ